jgi:trehalose-phosphatase
MERLTGKVLNQASEAPHLVVMLDFDGTISPIVSRPQDATLSEPRREILRELSQTPGTIVNISSGRMIADLITRVGIDGIILFGNHGLEIEGIDLTIPVDKGAVLRNMSRVYEKAKELTEGLVGVMIENKGFAVSIHYRQADGRDVARVIQITDMLINDNPGTLLIRGKMVNEIRSNAEWNKGAAALALLDRICCSHDNVLAIYAGDDTTDEDAFISLRDRAITVLVGKKESTNAHYYVGDVDEMWVTLRSILDRRRALASS